MFTNYSSQRMYMVLIVVLLCLYAKDKTWYCVLFLPQLKHVKEMNKKMLIKVHWCSTMSVHCHSVFQRCILIFLPKGAQIARWTIALDNRNLLFLATEHYKDRNHPWINHTEILKCMRLRINSYSPWHLRVLSWKWKHVPKPSDFLEIHLMANLALTENNQGEFKWDSSIEPLPLPPTTLDK